MNDKQSITAFTLSSHASFPSGAKCKIYTKFALNDVKYSSEISKVIMVMFDGEISLVLEMKMLFVWFLTFKFQTRDKWRVFLIIANFWGN